MQSAVASERRLCDRFTLREKLGAGGQGEVWRARDERLGVDVALKLLTPGAAQADAAFAALEREHAIASGLDHPYVLAIYPPQRDGDVLVLPMEYAAGGDLRRLRGASYLQIVPPLLEIAQALEHAHERGIVHRDLKPGNVLLDARGRVRLGDFGVASEIAAGAVEAYGLSPFSASPEHLRGEPPSPSDDIYGLGALAYELLSGYPPHYPRFERERVLEDPVPDLKPLQQAPPQLTALVMRMLAKRAQVRPRTMRAVIDELDATLNDTLTFEFDPARNDAVRAATPPLPSVRATGAPKSEPSGPSRPWGDLQIEPLPSARRFAVEPRPRRWPWLIPAALAVGVAVVLWLPEIAPKFAPLATVPAPQAGKSVPAAPESDASTPGTADDAGDEAAISRARQARTTFDQRLAGLEARGAGVWGGPDFANAKARAAQAGGVFDAGDPRLAEERLVQALKLLESAAARGAPALAAQLAAGERALEAGQGATARQAFESAQRIAPDDRRAAEGLRRARSLDAVLPLLAAAENAERARDYAGAAQNYRQALSLDPGNRRARAGLERAEAASGNDVYAKEVGQGFAALGAGRLEEARRAFEQAKGVRPSGREANDGLARVDTALRARGFASTRTRTASLETEERWSEALKEYEAALAIDPSLAFAQTGRTRAAARADLAERLQGLIDRPERLAAPAVRDEAIGLLARARAQSSSGPVLRSQIARLEILLPEFDKPVRLALESDNATQVAIQRVGSFGTFGRREIELKPGKYTVVGTRSGFRDVRRDVTVAPGQEVQTISVRCVEPI